MQTTYMQRTICRMRINCCIDRQFFCSSPSLTSLQPPFPMETHLWYIIPDQVKSERLLNQYLEILSPCEKENVFRMRDDKLRKRALLARALVRTTIARYQMNYQSQVSPRSLKFRKNIHGKPEVKWQHSDHWHPPPLHFNMSHTSSVIACGVTTGSPIGIDVEEKQRVLKHDILSFARRYFSKREVQFLTSVEDPLLQRQEFIKLWTLKESYVKALGKGFSGAPFKTFTVSCKGFIGRSFQSSGNSSFEASEIIVDSVDDPVNLTTNWRFMLLELVGSHYAAICTRKDSGTEGEPSNPPKLKVWNTIPFLEDKCVSGTNAVVFISRLT